MSPESRDVAWADRMEFDLSKWVESVKSEGIAPRDLECGLSWCIVEVVSTQGRIPEMLPHEQRKRKIFQMPSVFAPDIDDPTVTDFLMIFKRYCRSIGELLEGDGHLVPTFATVGQKC
jgi:hypothetical protein